MNRPLSTRFFLALLFLPMLSSAAELPAPSAPQTAKTIELNSQNERILQIRLIDGTVLSDALLTYQIPGSWMFPLVETAEILGIQIKVFPLTQVAQGTILRDSQTFLLKTSSCEVELSGFKHSYECEKVRMTGDEIYVEKSLLQAWFPVDFNVETYLSRVLIAPREKLPLQEKAERERTAVAIKQMSESYDPGFPRHTSKNKLFDGPFLDQQIGWNLERSDSLTSRNLTGATVASGTLAGFDALTTLSYTSKHLDEMRFTLERTDPDRHLGGILRLSKIQLIDVNTQSLPLISNARLTRGIHLTSFPLDYSSSFSSQDIQGAILPGWDIELYQNDVLIGRQETDAEGKYLFKGIPLYYGKNQFHLIAYGPQGQRKDDYRTYSIESNLLKPGETYYDFSYGTNALAPKYSFQLSKSLIEPLSLSVGTAKEHLALLGEDRTYGFVGLNSYFRSWILTLNHAQSQGNERGEQLSLKTSHRSLTLGSEYTLLNHFKSDSFNGDSGIPMQSQLKLNSSFVFPFISSLGVTFEFKRKHFEDDTFGSELTNRLASALGPVTWFHEARLAAGTWDTYSGRLDAGIYLGATAYRTALNYTHTALQSVEGEVKTKFDTATDFSTLLRHTFESKLYQTVASITHRFDHFYVSSNASYSSNHDFAVGILGGLSLERHDSDLHLNAQSRAMTGAVSVLVFVDSNRNGSWDENEKRLPNLNVTLAQKPVAALTQSDGMTWIDGLTPYAFYDVSVSSLNLEDPLLRPAQKGIRFYVRPGATSEIQFPFVPVAQIDGIVQTQVASTGSIKPFRNGMVALTDFKDHVIVTQNLDSNGIFWLEDVAPGIYKLKVISKDTKGEAGIQIRTQPDHYLLQIPELGSMETDKNFLILSK